MRYTIIMKYRYPDQSDRITIQLINEHELYPGYWSESEEDALALAGVKLSDQGDAMTALDVGCGEGRLLPWLGKYAAKVSAIEPDAKRFAVAKKAYPDIEIAQETIEDHVSKEGYDIVLSSHIIQHIPTTRVMPMLERLYNLTNPGGNTVLLYSRSAVGDEHYSVDRLQKDRLQSTPVDETVFNAVSDHNGKDVLPVHFFDPDALKATAEKIGWKETFRWTFHVIDPEFADGKNPDKKVNSSRELFRKFGRDMLVVWQRPDREE